MTLTKFFQPNRKRRIPVSTMMSPLRWRVEFSVINTKAIFKKLILQTILKMTSKCRIRYVAFVSSSRLRYYSYLKERLRVFFNPEIVPLGPSNTLPFSSLLRLSLTTKLQSAANIRARRGLPSWPRLGHQTFVPGGWNWSHSTRPSGLVKLW